MSDGYYQLPTNAKRGACRSCHQPIAWITTAKGAQMPLDLATVEQRDGVTMALNHFATCPHSRAWSNRSNYHGPTGDVNDPEATRAVEQLAELRKAIEL